MSAEPSAARSSSALSERASLIAQSLCDPIPFLVPAFRDTPEGGREYQMLLLSKSDQATIDQETRESTGFKPLTESAVRGDGWEAVDVGQLNPYNAVQLARSCNAQLDRMDDAIDDMSRKHHELKAAPDSSGIESRLLWLDLSNHRCRLVQATVLDSLEDMASGFRQYLQVLTLTGTSLPAGTRALAKQYAELWLRCDQKSVGRLLPSHSTLEDFRHGLHGLRGDRTDDDMGERLTQARYELLRPTTTFDYHQSLVQSLDDGTDVKPVEEDPEPWVRDALTHWLMGENPATTPGKQLAVGTGSGAGTSVAKSGSRHWHPFLARTKQERTADPAPTVASLVELAEGFIKRLEFKLGLPISSPSTAGPSAPAPSAAATTLPAWLTSTEDEQAVGSTVHSRVESTPDVSAMQTKSSGNKGQTQKPGGSTKKRTKRMPWRDLSEKEPSVPLVTLGPFKAPARSIAISRWQEDSDDDEGHQSDDDGYRSDLDPRLVEQARPWAADLIPRDRFDAGSFYDDRGYGLTGGDAHARDDSELRRQVLPVQSGVPLSVVYDWVAEGGEASPGTYVGEYRVRRGNEGWYQKMLSSGSR